MSNLKPLVSVCVPVYNNEDYIEETIENILCQSYPNIELIIVDDNSRDESLKKVFEVCNNQKKRINRFYDFSKKEIAYIQGTNDDPAITAPQIDFKKNELGNVESEGRTVYVYKNHDNLGMSGNWNRCLSLCRGKYIKLICADDLIADNLIEKEVEILESNPDVLDVESDTEFRDSNGKPQGQYKRYKAVGAVDGIQAVRHSLFSRNYLGAPLANTFRKTAYEELGGFDPRYHYIVDYDFFIKLALAGKIYIIHEPLNYFRIRNDSNTGEVLGGDKGAIYQEEHRKLVKKFQAKLGFSNFQMNLSVFIRGMMNKLGGLYLKLHLKG
jgi:glycosyltransferase involved in cell wall biosynthesis